MTKQHGQLQAWDRAHGWHDVLEAKWCSVCKRTMSDDECGDEFPEERVCDKCAGYCDMSDVPCEVCEVIDCHRASEFATEV